MSGLWHIDSEGRPRKADVGDKAVTSRRADACNELRCVPETFATVRGRHHPQGAA